MGRGRAVWIAAAVGLALVAHRGRGRAETPPVGDAVAEAKELFRKGVALYEARDLESALDYFRRSRTRFPSLQNTLDVAICLEGLGRVGEALEAYDEVIASFGGEVADAERASIAGRMDAMRSKVASLDVTSNVSGLLIVDGRERGKLPLGRALRITGGHHVVRVMKDGYATFEAEIDVAAGARLDVDARLVALAVSGGLRVEDPALVGGDVLVDGAVVGVLPWEGTLAPGEHFVASRARTGNADTGSAPTRALVVQGQTALVQLRSGALGGVARVVVRPRSATLRLNGVPIGKGQWEGALPEGAYRVEADELGYFAKGASFHVSPGTPAFRGDLDLAIDAEHPHWPRPPGGHFSFGAFAGYGGSPSLGSGAEQSCASNCSRGTPNGAIAGVRAGYELGSRFSIEAAAGYLYVHSPLSRSVTDSAGSTYRLADDVRVQGFWLGAGASYRIPVGGGFGLRPRLGAGFVVAHSSDPLTATAERPGASVAAVVGGAGDSTHTTPFFASAELGLERAWGSWRVALALHAFFIPVAGPASSLGNIDCARASCTSSAVAGERAYGAFVLVMPQLSATWDSAGTR